MTDIKVKHTSIEIPNYTIGDNLNLERQLSVWDKIYHKYIPKGYMIDDNGTLKLPRGIDLSYIEKTFNRPLEIDYECDKYDSISLKLKIEPRDDIQRNSISFLIGEANFKYTQRYSQLSLNLDTGDGKTYCCIAALTFLKMKTMIITHQNGIKNQWLTSLLKMTNIDPQFILDINGSKVIDKILQDKLKGTYKIFLINHRTLYKYAQNNGWGSISELFKKLKIGLKIFDEAHLEFTNLINVDLNTNTKKTIYLTANFNRSEYKEDQVFNLCFKNIAKYGIETRSEKRKHIVYLGYIFNSKPSLDTQIKVKGSFGFDKNKYIDYQLSKPIFLDALKSILDYLMKKEGKILILLSKIDATEHVADFLINSINGKTIAVYNSTKSASEKEEALNSDIIVSTPTSLGVGSDIKGLRSVIMTEPYSSKIKGNQAAGRLREIPDEKTMYVEMVDKGFSYVQNMYKNRLPVFKKKCVSLFEIEYK